MNEIHAFRHETRNPLSENSRGHLIDLLNRTLCTAIDLHAQAKQAHWNVRGPNFIALHELFDGVATAGADFVDRLAERVTALGGIAMGTLQLAAKLTALRPYPVEIVSEQEHLEALSAALGEFARVVRTGIDMSDDLDDAITADLLTQVGSESEKQLWLVESHLNG
jgi:starvation-inducible DNA-binding protein